MALEKELDQREIERLKKLLELFPRDSDVEDAAELIQNAKAIVRVVVMVKYAFNVITVATALAVGYFKWKIGATSE